MRRRPSLHGRTRRYRRHIEILRRFAAWAGRAPHIDGALLIGSFARGAPRLTSDIDLQILSRRRDEIVRAPHFLATLGQLKWRRRESYGAVEAWRAGYEGGVEIEICFGWPSWARARPIDPGTAAVIATGAVILQDRGGQFTSLLRDASAPSPGRARAAIHV